ncbi:hypothetical protein GCM10027403_03120 [Arthrobacter tecti]
MIREHVPRLRIVIGAIAFLAMLVQIVVIPRIAANYANDYPEVAYLAPPYVVAIVIAIGSFEVALLAAWQLLSAAEAGDTLTSRSPRWANVVAASLLFMAMIFAGVCVHAGSVASVGGPAMLFGLLASLAVVPAAFALRKKTMGSSLVDDVVPGRIAESEGS